jgi:signal transduction histidine kinase
MGLWHEIAIGDKVFELSARPMENGHELEDWVLVINDVTQQREIQQHIQHQERLAAVGQLAAGIAHDFNNIMATIVLYAQVTARMEELPSVVRERMGTINQQAGHATKLIQQILDFSRQAVLERQPLDLALLLKDHVRLLKRTLPESIEVELTHGPSEHMVRADPTRMQQVVTNLAVNARDAMPGGGTLHIRLERIQVRRGESPLMPEMDPGGWVQMTVSDTGTGIPPDVLPHIFNPFFTTKAPGEGSGLGLAQVHGIVGQHGGRIDVESCTGEGTTFTIYLPALATRPPKPSSVSELGKSPTLPTGKGESILVVEDNAIVRKALVESLELLNYHTREATNGQEALAMLEQHGDDVDLLLSDVVMPGMGGVALLHALRESGLTVKVVMITGHLLEKELDDLRAQGMIDWLYKPPELDDLAEVVARVLGTD